MCFRDWKGSTLYIVCITPFHTNHHRTRYGLLCRRDLFLCEQADTPYALRTPKLISSYHGCLRAVTTLLGAHSVRRTKPFRKQNPGLRTANYQAAGQSTPPRVAISQAMMIRGLDWSAVASRRHIDGGCGHGSDWQTFEQCFS